MIVCKWLETWVEISRTLSKKEENIWSNKEWWIEDLERNKMWAQGFESMAAKFVNLMVVFENVEL